MVFNASFTEFNIIEISSFKDLYKVTLNILMVLRLFLLRINNLKKRMHIESQFNRKIFSVVLFGGRGLNIYMNHARET